MSVDALLPAHRALIEGSAIAPDVALERGYRSVIQKAELKRLGFGDKQCRVPALLIPIWGVTGNLATYQIRPDEPRVVDGKPIKYETPRGSRMVLDIPRRCREQGWLGDPQHALFITEGARKADAGVSKGLCTIALLGVWNWRGTNEHGGKAALPDWESIALNGRDVYIVFDSDVMSKLGVHQALARLKPFLESRNANVRIVYLPHGADGTKVGLDDYLAKGGDIAGLLNLATDELRDVEGSKRQSPYARTSDGRTVHHKPDRDGEIAEVTLANFTAEIVALVEEHDGVESSSSFLIRAHTSEGMKEVTVPVAAFHLMNWPSELLGPKAIVTAGMGNKDRLREAVQTLSPDRIPTRRVYRHLGWIKRDGNHIYLHAGGGIGTQGTVEGVEVRLDPPLDQFALPAPPIGDEAQRAVRESLALLEGLAPDHIMFPLFSIIWVALIHSSRESVHLTGKTGERKTELAALDQRHFGAAMDADHLPGSWSSTANYNETMGFHAKDALVVVDDFCPTGSVPNVQQMHRDADRVFRSHANASGRGRLRADGSSRPPKAPRGMLLSTGEDVPAGHSLRARVLILELGVGEVDLEKLTRRQAAGAFYPQTTAAFVAWAATQLDGLRQSFASEALAWRQQLLHKAPHGRTATFAGELLAGLTIFFRFALEIGAIDAEAAQTLRDRAERSILRALKAQGEHQEGADPTQLFVQLIGATLRAGDAHLDARDGGVPKDSDLARSVGWRGAECTTKPTDTANWQPGGPCIGWIEAESDSVYLNPGPAYRAAQKQADQSPSRIGIAERTLWKRLDEAKLLASTDEGRHTLKVRFGKSTLGVLHLRASLVLGESRTSGTEGVGTQGATRDEDMFSICVPDSSRPQTGTGTENGNTTSMGDDCQPSGMTVPDVPDLGDQGRCKGEETNCKTRDQCRICGGTHWWRRAAGGAWCCVRCVPPGSAARDVVYSDGEGAIAGGPCHA